ncbi:hypothetical protein B0181_11890 [Moraxella caviae]|uniref:Uncharacterized protein n=1 Tax=Moraxella caviae TaxID=34060 RepID=A0A1S9ZQC1_9GAMM|nr:hypothetical protein [Moraxella caviae]OOR85822.1 hypothetical protein B0181_11890 [Moraxella caviae]STZ13712.1 Uncharacterised protein [Moraxella caviae]
MDKDYQEYKDFDMTGAIRGIPPQIARLQAKNQTNVKTEQARLLDDDVMAWVVRQDQDTKNIINQMIRGMMSIQQKQATTA